MDFYGAIFFVRLALFGAAGRKTVGFLPTCSSPIRRHLVQSRSRSLMPDTTLFSRSRSLRSPPTIALATAARGRHRQSCVRLDVNGAWDAGHRAVSFLSSAPPAYVGQPLTLWALRCRWAALGRFRFGAERKRLHPVRRRRIFALAFLLAADVMCVYLHWRWAFFMAAAIPRQCRHSRRPPGFLVQCSQGEKLRLSQAATAIWHAVISKLGIGRSFGTRLSGFMT